MKKLQEFSEYSNLRNIGKMNYTNDGTRSLSESIAIPEVELALKDWIENNDIECVLIGGLALSYYVKPRYTMDVDVLFLSKNDIPKDVYKFKHHRPSAFQHDRTHVEVEAITPSLINAPSEFIQKIFDTANEVDGIKVASPSGIVALKLGRFSDQDQADIKSLINYTTIDLTIFVEYLTDEQISKYNNIIKSR